MSTAEMNIRFASPGATRFDSVNASTANSSNLKVRVSPTKSVASTTAPVWTLLRTILLDLPLALLFASFLFVYACQYIHSTYYIPLYDRAQRTNEDLYEEFTYYHRHCTSYDLSTHHLPDLLVNASASLTSVAAAKEVVEDAVDTMLRHGAIVLPDLLTADAVRDLRSYVERRNAAISDTEVYPVSQGDRRLSYGIDATEDPAVVQAIRQIANHTPLRAIMQALLGDPDPASAEITAITAYPGAEDQSWHADTKEDGNALKFARTYSHSYSLFLPLQETTAAMGPTDVCPGTHYCANDVTEMCDTNKMGLHEANEDLVFHAGDGALLNQHVWHRGSAHTDPNAMERIVFIVSFLARPKFGKDPRQLSRGTYFHQKWNMWGHTWKDLMDPMASMGKPFSILRCLSIYKPWSRNWGYDLVTSAFMRFSNEQLENEDLEFRLLPRLEEVGLPSWLWGTVSMEEGQRVAWQTFISETLNNTFTFLAEINVKAHAVYGALIAFFACIASIRRQSGVSVFRRNFLRVLLTHGVLLGVTFMILRGIRTSEWGSSVLSGRTLQRPFPSIAITREVEDRMLIQGPTTVPHRSDVLIGSRYDAAFLGSYDRWLDYHAGNSDYLQIVENLGPLYRSYQRLGPFFTTQVENNLLSLVEESEGRFLQQNFRTGDWQIMDEEEARLVVHDDLIAWSKQLLWVLRRSIDHMVADYRFGLFRQTSLARYSQVHLLHLRRTVLGNRLVLSKSSRNGRPPSLQSQLSLSPLRIEALSHITIHRRSLLPPAVPLPEIREGSRVWCNLQNMEWDWYPGVVENADENYEFFDVALEDGFIVEDVAKIDIRQYPHIKEGIRVHGCFGDGLEDCFPGTVFHVMPNRDVGIEYDDGDVEDRVPPSRYFVPPFAYESPS
jgi:hypothetical protein|uniref:Uncharacterized protein n=1 Tax=Phaeodactylum tricornutum TaxID=2850 RepID=A0A8J9TFH8_PHATR